jgi:hypothetical protein
MVAKIHSQLAANLKALDYGEVKAFSKTEKSMLFRIEKKDPDETVSLQVLTNLLNGVEFPAGKISLSFDTNTIMVYFTYDL